MDLKISRTWPRGAAEAATNFNCQNLRSRETDCNCITVFLLRHNIFRGDKWHVNGDFLLSFCTKTGGKQIENLAYMCSSALCTFPLCSKIWRVSHSSGWQMPIVKIFFSVFPSLSSLFSPLQKTAKKRSTGGVGRRSEVRLPAVAARVIPFHQWEIKEKR